jgi:hypothetical protein
MHIRCGGVRTMAENFKISVTSGSLGNNVWLHNRGRIVARCRNI